MKILYALISALLLLHPLSAEARVRGSAANIAPPSGAQSQLGMKAPNGGADYPTLNYFKQNSGWGYGNTSGAPSTGALIPSDLDGNGYPVSTGAWPSFSGASASWGVPSQAIRPGRYVFLATGQINAEIGLTPNGVNALVSCTGGVGAVAGNGIRCNNTGCSTFTGSIAGTTLTVTAAPTGTGCALGAGLPISGANVTVSKFGTPTIITSAGAACGPNTCYTVNQSQTATSSTMVGGMRAETRVTTPSIRTTNDNWFVKITATGAGSLQGSNFAWIFNDTGGAGAGDETAFWNSHIPCGGAQAQACIVGPLFKNRVKDQLNIAVLRDLDWINSNISNCTTWGSRKPINHYSYNTWEARNAPVGNDAQGFPNAGQYVDATGTGASGGTISYNGGTDTYSITLGTGPQYDKQTILALIPTTGTNVSKISINGNTAVPIRTAAGNTPLGSTFIPTAKRITALVYDADFGAFLTFADNGSMGLNCVMPVEVIIEINAELGTTPWHVIPYMTMDKMTNWVSQYATYLKANYTPPLLPQFETNNEPFNCNTFGPNFLSAKSTLWIAQDTNGAWLSDYFCGGNGANYGELAKMGSTVGQDLNVVYGAGNYELHAPVQTYFGGASVANQIMRGDGYIGQSMAPQSGYTNSSRAYTYYTRISVNNYWNVGWYGPYSDAGTPGGTVRVKGLESAAAYCYYNYAASAPCQGLYASQTAVMTAYMNSASISGLAAFNLPDLLFYQQQWYNWALYCSYGVGSRPVGCSVNQTVPLKYYEGGYNESPNTPTNFAGSTDSSGDIIQPVALPTTAAAAAFTIPNNGCVQGQSVAIAGLTGGTWSSANGTYTVQSVTTDTCTLNLNSTGLGTFGSTSTTATAGWSVGSSTISVASCSGISNGQYVANSNTGKFIGNVNSCSSTTLTLQQFKDSTFALNAGSNGNTLVFSTATITYTGSNKWIPALRTASYLAPELQTLTMSVYNQVLANGGSHPSQYQLSSAGGANPWFIMAPDIIGYYPVASSTSSTIATNQMTLGGTVTGIFRIGDTILSGGALTGLGTGAGSNTTISGCTPVGSNVCGTTAGDILTLSQNSTIASGQAINGVVAPPTNFDASGTTSPVRSYGGICQFNGNAAKCNGP